MEDHSRLIIANPDHVCVVCGAHFIPSNPHKKRAQTTCGRACGAKKRSMADKRSVSWNCLHCGKEKSSRPSEVRTFCSNECHIKHRIEGKVPRSPKKNPLRIKWVCEGCGKEKSTIPSKRKKYCSRQCGGWEKLPIGSVRLNLTGYREIKISETRWRAEHILVAEQEMGRPLGPKELVHHRNGNKSDNRWENLQVMPKSAHARLHQHAEWVGLSMIAQQTALPMLAGEWIHPIEGCEV